MKVISIKKIKLETPEPYYDISVDKHNNFVINNSIVVHNCFYHHGSVSIENAIITMVQKFKNNIPFLEEDGQFGSLRSPQAGASRYIGTKLSPYFNMIYKDFDLLEYRYEEGEKIEPFYFLPIIPTILLNGTTGIAVGFASIILSRNILDIIDSCLSILNSKKIININPYLDCFSGIFKNDEDNHKKWFITGTYKKVNSNTIEITELPISMTYEKYEEVLDKLIEDKIILSYEDKCQDSISYLIRINKTNLENLLEKDIIKIFKLEEQVTENYTTLDEFGKLKIFDNVTDIIKYFVNFRLKFYTKRKNKQILNIDNELLSISNKYKFIKLILDNKLVINNTPKNIIVEKLKEYELDKIDNSYDYLLRLPIISLTKEISESLSKDMEIKKKEKINLENTNPKDMYIKDLKILRDNFKK